MCACPQTENGYTKIANELMEALAGIRISGEARQCLDVIFRKTYGYNKKEDNIALSQFVLLTKMPKPEICRALRKLAKMNIIIIKNANDFGNIYRILKDYSLWKPLAKMPTIGKNAKGRWQKCQLSLAKKGHTKDNTTKDNTTKDNKAPPSGAKIFYFNSLKEKMLSSKDIRMPIISLYWTYKKIEFKNKEQYQAGLKRELRAAKLLTGYSFERIKEVMFYLNGQEWMDWVLSTVHKYIDKDLIKLNEKDYEKPKRNLN